MRGGRRLSIARLPPLNALRVFVVAARRGSFGGAAQELHVSSAAIGQQVRLLEDHLGGPLFVRRRGRLELTPLGAALAPGLEEGFAFFIRALERQEAGPRAPLRLSVPPAFAQKWLIPRLDRLHAALPGLDIAVEPSAVALTDLAQGEADCAIRYGAGRVEGVRSARLFAEALLPMCSPGFAERHRLADRGPAALPEVPLLHETGRDCAPGDPDWRRWLQVVRPEDAVDALPDPLPGARLSQAAQVLEAAAAGRGIALGKLRLAEQDLTAGTLVSPFGAPWPLRAAYAFVTPDCAPHRPEIDLIRDWFLAEAREAPPRI